MKLSFETIQSITIGAVTIRQDADGGITLRRFTDEQAAVYNPTHGFFRSTMDTASIALDFYTDSDFLRFTADGLREKGENFVVFDLLVNGQLTQTLHFSHTGDQPADKHIPYGPVGDTFYLPSGEKRITFCLPWGACARLLSVELSDGAFVRPCNYKYTWLAFGDSITHGAYASHPALTYVNQLSRMLDAKVYNFGIGGERFREKKIIPGSYPKCDFVTIAYGTNDYRHQTKEAFDVKMPSFLRQAAEAFPDVPIFVITPSWRNAEKNDKTWEMGRTLSEVRTLIAAEAAKYPNMHVVDGSALVPHCHDFFGDSTNLHPNDAGFAHYATNLYRAISPYLD